MPREAPATPVRPASTSGPKPHEPTEQQQVMVKMLTAAGIVQDSIAAAIGISVRVLRKHYRRELQIGATETALLAVNSLVRAMNGGGKEAVVAAKWWTQSRMGWSEKILVDDGKPADQPMRVIVELMGDPAPPSDDKAAGRGARMPSDAVELLG